MRTTSSPSEPDLTPAASVSATSDPVLSGGVKPVAFQPASGMSLGTILSLVVFAHLLVIVLLLTHFGWPGGIDETDESGSGQTGLVIPVTLESADESETTQQVTQEPESLPIPAPPVEKPVDIQLEQTNDPTESPKLTEPAAEPVTTPMQPATPAESSTQMPSSSQTPANNTAQPLFSAGSGGSSIQQKDIGVQEAAPVTAAQIDPNYLHRPDPVYPVLSKRMREQGKVLLRVSLDAQGVVKDIAILKSSDFQRLDQAALEAVRQWRFIPAKRGTESIAATVDVPIEFRQP